jgi:hypothetical protein
MGTSDMTIELLKSRLHYDPETGLFTRISKCSTKKVGKPDKDGYITIKVDGTNYQAHRLAFMYMTGRFPVITDHINRVRWDNRWCNLREVSMAENLRNRRFGSSKLTESGSTSGHRHVYRDSRKNKWVVQVRHEGKAYYNGCHHLLEDAVMAAEELRNRLSAEVEAA